ncbi:IS1595 family transposase [Nitrospira sp. Nam80]
MSEKRPLPTTLQEAIRYFSDPDTCLNVAVSLRWPNGPICPRCASKKYRFIKTRSLWECKDCKKQYSVKVGTIFEDSPINLDKWLCAFWLIANAKNGISSHEIARSLGVTQKTAWFMMHRIRFALHHNSFDTKLSGEVEADETFIGGVARNMHWVRQRKMQKAEGGFRKSVVMGVLERKGEVRARVIDCASARLITKAVRENVEPGSTLYTDQSFAYKKLATDYAHKVVNHAERYVEGKIYTNGIENFWSLLKRGLKGTYVSVEPFHLFRYLDEQTFRFNARKGNDQERFMAAASLVPGKRLTYHQLTGESRQAERS